MKKIIRRALAFFFLGVLASSSAMVPVYLEMRKDVQRWKDLQAGTRDSWLKDREEWAAGKPFEYRHGQHHHRW